MHHPSFVDVDFFMFLIAFLSVGSFLLIIQGKRIIDWVRNLRLARQQPSAQEEATFEENFAKDLNVSVALLDPDLLECPICCEPLKIPIFQCTYGHLACSVCSKKVKNLCPSCKSPIGFSRCRAMEKVTESFRVSCRNAKYGCKEIPSYQNRSSHEKQCHFAPVCPVRGCNYTGSHKDLKKHVNVKHNEGLILFKWDTPLRIEPSALSEKITILREKKDGELIVIRGSKGSDGMLVSVSCIAPLETEMGRLSCSLELRSLTNTLNQILILKGIQKMSEEQPKDDFVLIPSYMLWGIYSMEICIRRCRINIS